MADDHGFTRGFGPWCPTIAMRGSDAEYRFCADLFPEYGRHQFGGMLLNVIVGVTGIVISLPLGVMLALGRQSDMPVLRTCCVIFIEFIRGVPLITLLFVASTMLSYFLPPGTSFDLLLRVLIMVTLFSAAYLAEVGSRVILLDAYSMNFDEAHFASAIQDAG